jgi:cytochrome c553
MIIALLLFAQSAAPDGAALYKQHCSTPYCHGAAGTAGRASALAGRRFETAHLRNAIAEGIPSKGMPAFREEIGDGGIDALVAYIRSLDMPPAAKKAAAPAKAGRDLFFDSSRLPSCSECHPAGDIGSPIAAKLTGHAAPPVDVGSPRVQTAQIHGEPPFTALIAQESAGMLRVYDLSSPLPVLRTVPQKEITLKAGATWSHRSVTDRYSRAELAAIRAFLLTLASDIDNR